jgi:biopolymer transport protein ExbB
MTPAMPTLKLPTLLLAQAADAASAAPSKTMFDYILDGGVLSFVLVGLSVVALGLIIRNLVVLRPGKISPIYVFEPLERLARSGDARAALDLCESPQNDCMLAQVVAGGLRRAESSSFGLLELREGMEEAGRHEVDRLHAMNDGIGIISAVGPMLGLLGTVIGMIGAFGTISALQGAARSSELARFMSMALVNTAEGLIVAIPCTIAFALFRRRINRLAGDAAQDAEDLARLFLASSPASAEAKVPPRPIAAAKGAA